MITGTVVVFIPYVFSISIARYLYFVSFFIVFKEVFLSVGIIIIIAKYLSAHLKFSLRLQWEAKNLNYIYNLM